MNRFRLKESDEKKSESSLVGDKYGDIVIYEDHVLDKEQGVCRVMNVLDKACVALKNLMALYEDDEGCMELYEHKSAKKAVEECQALFKKNEKEKRDEKHK